MSLIDRIKRKLNEEGLIRIRYWQACLIVFATLMMFYLMFWLGIFVGYKVSPQCFSACPSFHLIH